MAEIFKFFNSAPGDERWHYASDFADYFGSVLSSGLISNGNSPVGLQVTVNSGTMTTSVNVGRALIKGYSYENTTPLTLTHSIPEQTLDRIDRVVLRLDLKNASRFIKVFVKEGVSALEPIPPTLQRDQYIYELSLAQVRIRKNTSSIVVSDIKDERADENLCGIVQSLITVPTSVFQQQFEIWKINFVNTKTEEFENWMQTLEGILSGDVAGNLLTLINENKSYIQALIKQKPNITLLSSNWTFDNTLNLYKYRLDDLDITSSSVVDVNIHVFDIPKARALLSANESFDGYVQLYANSGVDSNLVIDYRITKEVVA